MATKSVLKNIDIRDNKTGRAFLDAIKRSEDFSKEKIELRHESSDVTKKDIKSFFGIKD